MPTCLEFEAKNVEKAVEEACRELNVSRDKIRYDVISYGSSGIFGLVGVKKARIRVTVSDKRPDLRNPPKTSQSASEKTDKDRSEKRSDEQAIDQSKTWDSGIQSKTWDSGIQSKTWDSGTQGKTWDSGTQGKTWDSGIQSEDWDFGTQSKTSDSETQSETWDSEENESEKEISDNEDETNRTEANAEYLEIGKHALQRIIDFITTDATISVKETSERILFHVKGGNSGVLIGKRGQTLEAIQYLVEKIVNKNNRQRVRIQVDIEGYLDSRRAKLRNLASRLSEKAKRTGRPVTVGQLNAHDRRIVHISLRDDTDVRTQSMGEGFYRKLVIFPKKSFPQKREPF